MDDDKNTTGGLPPRQMFQGKWECAECGAKITELPFEPSGDRPLHCKECWAKKRDQRGGGGGRGFGPRKMFQGDWTCADCGTKITELPFQPSADQPIRCRDCWMKTKGQ